MNKINVGIDLGTTYSAVATFSKQNSRVNILKNSFEKECTPSVVCIENGTVLIGEDAKTEQKAGNINTVAFYKSMMGDENYMAFVDGNDYSAEDLSGEFLTALVRDIEETNGVEIEGAVITVPAYFNDKQREATIRAGQKAGLKVLKIINEPTAAIIAYGLTGGAPKNVLVYDLGGGTFDVTIAHVNGTSVDVIATNGNHQLGGKDWDEVLLSEIKEKFYDEYGVNIDDYPEDLKELQVKCEEAKKRLSSVGSSLITIQCEGYLGKYEVTRESFDDKTYSLLYETVLLIKNSFDEISEARNKPFGWADIDEVVLVGGSTRMPQVRDMIISEYGKPPITKDINVDTIVATGAAMQAELCVSNTITLTMAGKPSPNAASTSNGGFTLTIKNSDIKDITSHSLGMLALDSKEENYINSIIIRKNSKVNEVFSKEYTFSGQTLDVYVLQGESRDPFECDMIGKYSISGMPRGQKNKITVNFLYNSNGVVEVNAKLDDGTVLQATKNAYNESLYEIIERLKVEREEAKKIKPIEVMLMIDTSGSMSGDRMTQAKSAAKEFVRQFNLDFTYISVASFSDSTRFHCEKENKLNTILSAVDRVTVCDTGVGNSETPITTNYKSFSYDRQKVIVILTDGYWSYQSREEESAKDAKSDGIVIYGIGIGDADESFLSNISTGSGKKVDLSQLTATFKDVASSIATEMGGHSLK